MTGTPGGGRAALGAQAGRQRQEDLAARVVTGAAGARQPEAGPARRGAGSRPRPAGPSVTTTTMHDPAGPGRRPRRGGSCAPDRRHRRPSAARRRRSSPAPGHRRVCPDGSDPRRRADAALPARGSSCRCPRRPRPRRAAAPVPAEAGPRDSASRTSSCASTCIRRASDEERVVALRDQRDDHVLDADRRLLLGEQLARRVVDPADVHRRGEEHRRLGQRPTPAWTGTRCTRRRR